MYCLSRSKFERSSYFLLGPSLLGLSFLKAAAINLGCLNPGTSKHPHMSNRIYDPLDSEYRVYFLICYMFRGHSKEQSQRNTCFCVFKGIFFVRLRPSVKLEEPGQIHSLTRPFAARAS